MTLERVKVIELDKVLPLLGDPKKADNRALIEGVPVHVTGLRLATFKRKGLKCYSCGIEGKYFAAERNFNTNSPYHINLYAVNKSGEEILMTHDHLLARSLGGKNDISNTDTMCTRCNSNKSITERKIKEMLK